MVVAVGDEESGVFSFHAQVRDAVAIEVRAAQYLKVPQHVAVVRNIDASRQHHDAKNLWGVPPRENQVPVPVHE